MKGIKGVLRVSLLIFFICMFLSCTSKPRFTGNADLCGLVVDEQNKPVKGFVIRAFCGMSGMKSAVTNENGIFVIENVPSGKIMISGEKTNYSKLSSVNYQFINRADIFCCQVKSVKAVIKQVDELLMRDEVESACNFLDSVICEKDSIEWGLIQSYKFFLTDSNQKKKEIFSSLIMSAVSEYTKELEVFIK